jgi:nucleotide-binding universal stress UspA family protein
MGAAAESPPPASRPARRVMIASEGRPIGRAVVQRAASLAREADAEVFVMSIARVWGSSLGFPNPWLNPTKREWDEQKAIVSDAVAALEKSGLHAYGVVLATRRPGKRILKEARLREVDAIVMGCDPPRNRVFGDFSWWQEPQRVARRARGVPVHLIEVDAEKGRSGRRR